MDSTQGNTVLRRKLGLRAPAPTPGAALDARHLARALARATSAIPGLVGSCAEPVQRAASLAELLELIEGESFVALIADPAGAVGLAVLDPTGAVALIEALTIGRLSRRPPPKRRATPTDALLLSDVVDATLAEFDGHGAEVPGHRPGFRFQRFPADYRLLDLLLEAPRYDLVLQPLALLGEDVRRDGQFLLALPQPAAAEPAPEPSARRTASRGEGWTQALEAQVLAAPAQLTAVLGRVTLPLAEVMALSRDSRILLPLALLEEIELQALDGQVMGRGRLGQFRTMRAVRLTDPGAQAPAPEFEDRATPEKPRPAPPALPPAED